jgi:hypothetical protein
MTVNPDIDRIAAPARMADIANIVFEFIGNDKVSTSI